MVRIRLRRMGAKKQPIYRIVVADKESPRDGAFIEIIGQYNPRTQPETVVVQEDRALYWMKSAPRPAIRSSSSSARPAPWTAMPA